MSNLESPEIKVKVDGEKGGVAYLIGLFTEQQYGMDSTAVDAEGNIYIKYFGKHAGQRGYSMGVGTMSVGDLDTALAVLKNNIDIDEYIKEIK